MRVSESSFTRIMLRLVPAFLIYVVAQYVIGFVFGYAGAPKADAMAAAFYTSILMAGVALFVRWPLIDH